MIVDFDELGYICPYFTDNCPGGDGYGCTHPDADEAEEGVGRCWNAGCPVVCGLDEEDLDDPDLDWDGLERADFYDEDGKFIHDGQYATIGCDEEASEDEKKLLEAYQRYMHRYDKEWREGHGG